VSGLPLALAHEGGWDEGVAIALPLLGVIIVAGFALRGWWTTSRRLGPVPPAVRRRRRVGGVVVVGLLVVDVVAIVGFGLDEQWVAVARNLLFPGLGLFDGHTAVAVLLVALALTALVAWVRWGADWLVGAVWVGGFVVGVWLIAPTAAHAAAAAVVPAPPLSASQGLAAAPLARASHEFAAVMFLLAALARLRAWFAGLPGIRALSRRRHRLRPKGLSALGALAPVDRARVAAVAGLAERVGAPLPAADRDAIVAALQAPDVLRRARRVAAVARWRASGDPLRRDQAPIRAALALWGLLSPSQVQDLRDDADRQWTGVPNSEPGWVRLLDGTLVAAALGDLGDAAAVARWQVTLASILSLRDGHRPACAYTPLALPGPWAPAWEQAAAAGLAAVLDWPGDEWPALRQRGLGAAARGPSRPLDERLIAAGRVSARLAGDVTACRILDRPTVGADPLAVALDLVAGAVGVRAGASRPLPLDT
jgi:hypothetical protein